MTPVNGTTLAVQSPSSHNLQRSNQIMTVNTPKPKEKSKGEFRQHSRSIRVCEDGAHHNSRSYASFAILGFLFSVFGMQVHVYILAIARRFLVTGTLILCGLFLILHNATCKTHAMIGRLNLIAVNGGDKVLSSKSSISYSKSKGGCQCNPNLRNKVKKVTTVKGANELVKMQSKTKAIRKS